LHESSKKADGGGRPRAGRMYTCPASPPRDSPCDLRVKHGEGGAGTLCPGPGLLCGPRHHFGGKASIAASTAPPTMSAIASIRPPRMPPSSASHVHWHAMV